MKKNIICILLFCASFSLYAQTRSAAIFVPQVTGTGAKPTDNDYFHKQLLNEVSYQNFILAKEIKDAEFNLVAKLSEKRDNVPRGVRQYNIHLLLIDNKTGKTTAEGELIYEVTDDIKDLFPTLVSTLLNTIPESAGSDNWRNKILYAGASAIWSPRIYSSESVATYLTGFGGGVFAEYHFLNFLSVEAGVEIATDNVKVTAKAKDSYSNLLLEIPVLIKYVNKPGDNFMLEPYAGIHFNIPFKEATKPPLISALVGFQYGVKLGPGIIFIDPRFSMDIGKSVLNTAASVRPLSFQRYIIHLGIGYKFGFFTKR